MFLSSKIALFFFSFFVYYFAIFRFIVIIYLLQYKKIKISFFYKTKKNWIYLL